MTTAPGITPDKTEFRVRKAVSSCGYASLGSKRNFSRNPLNRFILTFHWPPWGNMLLVKPVTERGMELSWLTYLKNDTYSGVGDGDSFL